MRLFGRPAPVGAGLLFKNSSFNYISGWGIMDKNAL
jgi:hypothetical protein